MQVAIISNMEHITKHVYRTLLSGQERRALGVFPYAGITVLENTIPEEESLRWIAGYLLGRAILREGHRLVYVDTKPLNMGLMLSLASFFEEYLPEDGSEGGVFYYNSFSEKVELLRHVRSASNSIFFFDGSVPEEDLRSFVLAGHSVVFLFYGQENLQVPPDAVYTLSSGRQGIELCIKEGKRLTPVAEITLVEGEPIINPIEVVRDGE